MELLIQFVIGLAVVALALYVLFNFWIYLIYGILFCVGLWIIWFLLRYFFHVLGEIIDSDKK